jgi:hypothetical protein
MMKGEHWASKLAPHFQITILVDDSMQFGYAFAANYAEETPDGRFSAVSAGLDGYVLPVLPAGIRALYLVVNVSFVEDECGEEYELSFSVTMPDGNIIRPEQTTTLKPTPDLFVPGRPGSMYAVLVINNWLIMHYGLHYFNFHINKQIIGKMAFGVIEVQMKEVN